MSAPPCRRGCSLTCPVEGWGWVLDDRLPSPPAWRLAWCIVGLPDPLPADDYRDAFAAFEGEYGARELIRGLRLAADQPPIGDGWTGARRGHVVDLLDRYENAIRRVAS